MTEAEQIEQLVIRGSVAAWMETHGVIKDAKGRYIGGKNKVPITVNYLQEQISDALAWLHENNLPARILVLKPRQRGCSTFLTAALYHTGNLRPVRAAIIGAKEDQSKNLFEMLRLYSNQDGFAWGTERNVRAEDAIFHFGDGGESRVGILSAKEYDPGRSGTYQFVLGTEVARWSERGVANAADVLSGLLKCVQLEPGTTVIQETTAAGRSGDFYERWLDAVDLQEYQRLHRSGASVADKYIRIFAPWFAFPDLSLDLTPQQMDEVRLSLGTVGRYNSPDFGDEAEIMQRFDLTYQQVAWRRYAIDVECKRDPQIFEQDYPSTWQTAFLSSGRTRFNVWGIRHFEERARTLNAHKEWATIEWQGASMENVITRRVTEYEATLCIWDRPKLGNSYVIAVDPATGASQTTGNDPDCHSVLVLRKGKYEAPGGWHPPRVVARIVTPCRWDIDVLAEYVYRLHRYYGRCLIVPEVNMDRGLIEILKQKAVPIYSREVFNQRESKTTNQLGFQTNSATREAIIENLAKAIREYDTEGEGLDVACPNIAKQLSNFITSDRGKSEAAEGHHDDDVMALAIGLYCIDGATAYQEVMTERPLPRDVRRMEEQKKIRFRGNRERAGRSQYS
jgi:hypothetical protein